MKHILGHKMTQVITALIIGLWVYIIMYPADIQIFRKSSEFAVHSMFALLFLGFVFLIFNQTRLMFVSMLASGLLAFYLKTASNSDMMFPAENALPNITVTHFNLSSFDKSSDNYIDLILSTESDIVSFQEYTPDWDRLIASGLVREYPHLHRMVRIDLFGMAIFSKKPIVDLETFYYEKIPNIHMTINSGLQDVNIISSYIAPPGLTGKGQTSKGHLDRLSEYVSESKNPSIVLGEFNQVYWTNEIKEFRDETNLINSRRDISLSSKVPYDHIFYSELLECIQFYEIKDQDQNHLGITGVFQTKTSVSNPAILRTIGFSTTGYLN